MQLQRNQFQKEDFMINIQNNEKKMTTFNDKCQAFLNSLLPANSANSNSVNLKDNIAVPADLATDCTNSDSTVLHENQSNWSELTKSELENIIFSGATKK